VHPRGGPPYAQASAQRYACGDLRGASGQKILEIVSASRLDMDEHSVVATGELVELAEEARRARAFDERHWGLALAAPHIGTASALVIPEVPLTAV
jgi:hypothetical protein